MKKINWLLITLFFLTTALSYPAAPVSGWRADVDALSDNSRQSSASQRILHQLQTKPPASLIDALIEVVKSHPDSKARIRAAHLLGYAKAERARIALGEALLKDPVPAVRSATTFSLGFYGNAAIPFLKVRLHDPSTKVQVETMDALTRIGGPAIPEVLKRIEQIQQADKGGIYYLSVLGGLSIARDRRVADFFLSQAVHSNPMVRRFVVEGMGNLAWDPDYMPPPGQPTIGIGSVPVEKWFEITAKERQALIEALRRAMNDPDEEVREEAVRAYALVTQKVLIPRKKQETASTPAGDQR